jgi:hypothetical protein
MTHRHTFMGFAFESLPGWTDRTVLTLTAPQGPSGEAPKLMVAHEARRVGESVVTFSQRALIRLAAHLPEFNLLKSEEFLLEGRQGVRILFRWKGQNGVVEEAVAYVEAPGEEAAVVTLKCSSSKSANVGCWATLRQVLATATFEDLEEATAPYAVPLPAPPAPTAPPSRPSSAPHASLPVRQSGYYTVDGLPEIPMPRSAGERRGERYR